MVQEDCLTVAILQKSSKKLVIICGPTASGKTSLAIRVAEKLNTEIISADSMNVYKGLNVGTAKPTKEEREKIIHHLLDVVSPSDSFSVGDYKEIATPILDKILKDNKNPVICGGTGFYINSLIYDFSYGNVKGDLAVREKYFNMAKTVGEKAVYAVLKEKDPKSAEILHPNDLKRVIRALEICENGIKKSELNDKLTPIYNYSAYALDFEREELYNRIEKRVDAMINSGLVEEVKGLIDNGITRENQCMQGIGYKEIYSYFAGEISLKDAIDKIKLNTKHYAKRQITFFKRLNGIVWLKPQEEEFLAKRIIEDL